MPHLLGGGPAVGSNSFVISGQHTASGKPVIGNDPHLQIAYPSVWFQIGLHCEQLNGECTFDVSGFSMAGMPGIMIGRNADLVWGLTNLGGDVSDLVVEKNVGENFYQRDGRCLAYQTRTETIRVAGGEDVEIRVRTSVHGPVVSGLLAPDEQFRPVPGASENLSVALQWTALMPDKTGESFFALGRATNAEEVSAAAALMANPAENILFATASGDIGYQAPGKYPVRPVKAPADGRGGCRPRGGQPGADGRVPAGTPATIGRGSTPPLGHAGRAQPGRRDHRPGKPADHARGQRTLPRFSLCCGLSFPADIRRHRATRSAGPRHARGSTEDHAPRRHRRPRSSPPP